MTTAELYATVRTALGKIPAENTADIDNPDILEASVWILRRINNAIPETRVRYITSEINQPEYDVPDTVVRVRKVFYYKEIETDLMILGGIEIGRSERNEYYNFPSIYEIEQMMQKRGRPKIRFSFHPRYRKLVINPAPENAGRRYYYQTVEANQFAITDIPEDLEELLIVGCAWKTLMVVALRRSDLGGVIREGGFVTYPSTELKLFVDEYRNEFKMILEAKARVYM